LPLELATARLARDVREPKEVERLGPPASVASAILAGVAPKPQHSGFLRVQLQAELREALGHRRAHRARGLLVLEAQHRVVGIAHHVDLTSRVPLPPLLGPQVEQELSRLLERFEALSLELGDELDAVPEDEAVGGEEDAHGRGAHEDQGEDDPTREEAPQEAGWTLGKLGRDGGGMGRR
jgi:hypothetical protein